MAELRINGSIKEYDDNTFPTLLCDLISELKLENVSIVAEIDGKIVRKEQFTTFNLNDGMNIELVKFVGGG